MTNTRKQSLLDRLEMMSDDTPQNCQTVDNTEPVLLARMEMTNQKIRMMEDQPRLNKNPSSKWTTLSTASGPTKSLSSKRSLPSYQSSISTHPGLRERKMQPWGTTQKHLMRFKPYLLQRLGEVESSKTHWNQREETQTERNLLDSATMTKSTNSSPKSVETPRDQEYNLQEVILTMKSTPMEPPTKNGEFSNPRCLGKLGKKKPEEAGTETAKNPEKFFTSSLETTKSSNSGSKLLGLHPLDSLRLNGTTLSGDNLSTSTPCSPHCTTFQLLKRTLDTWDTLKSPSEDLNLQKRSKRVASGPAPGIQPSKRSSSLFLTESKNSENTVNISRDISLPKSHLHIDESSFTTSPSAMKSGEARTPYSLTPISSRGFSQPSSCPTESNLITLDLDRSDLLEKRTQSQKSAIASTQSMGVGTCPTIAVSDMLANDANEWVTEKNLAMSKTFLAHELHLKYLRYN